MEIGAFEIVAVVFTIIGGLAGLIALILYITDRLDKKKKELHSIYEIKWKPSSKINPVDILGIRAEMDYGFKEYYFSRAFDDEIREKIAKGEHILVVGNSLAGKTRAVYEALKASPDLYVTVPRVVDINLKKFCLPSTEVPKERKVLFLDDINRHLEKDNFMHLIKEFMKDGATVVATCRTEPEFELLKINMKEELAIFGESVLAPIVSDDEAEQVRKDTGVSAPDGFDHNIGSLFLPLVIMKERFRDSSDEEKVFLRSMKKLFLSGVYEGREEFSIKRIIKVCENEGIEKKKYELDKLVEGIEKNGFIKREGGSVKTEEAYMEKVVDEEVDLLINFEEMIEIFSEDPDALRAVGNKAWNIGQVDLRKAALMKVALKAFNKAIKKYTIEDNPDKYAMLQNDIGTGYSVLAEIEDKQGNCKRAITAYDKALEVYTLKDFPIDYAMTQNNLGNTYRILGEIEDKPENCKRAIAAYEEALKVYTLKELPMDYAGTQNHLGTAYRTQAEVEDRAENSKKAITACEEALKVYNIREFPKDYAMTQNNLGTAYGVISKVEDKPENCKRAIEAFEKALKVYTLNEFPMDYSMTQNNLGNAYRILSEVEDKPNNCRKAITAYEETLKIYTEVKFPFQYESVSRNLARARKFCADATTPEQPQQ